MKKLVGALGLLLAMCAVLAVLVFFEYAWGRAMRGHWSPMLTGVGLTALSVFSVIWQNHHPDPTKH